MKPIRSTYPPTHICNPAFRYHPSDGRDTGPDDYAVAAALRMLQRVAERMAAQPKDANP